MIEIKDDYVPQLGDNYETNIVFDLEEGVVRIEEKHKDSGQSYKSFQGKERTLAWFDHARFVDMNAFVEHLEQPRSQDKLKTIQNLNYHGLGSEYEEAFALLHELGDELSDEVAQNAPVFWDAEEWFSSQNDQEFMNDIMSHRNLQEAVDNEINASYNYHLCEHDLKVYISKRLERIAEEFSNKVKGFLS